MRLPKIAAVAVALVLFFCGRRAAAERDLIVPFHEGGHLVFDQLSGMRASAVTGVSYAGPLGVAYRSEAAEAFSPGGAGAEAKTTTLWLAPSFDVFVTDHLSVGGLVEIAHTWGAVESGSQRLELPGATSMTFMPRVGFFVPFGDRFGLWPRLGLGWMSAGSARYPSNGGPVVRESFRAMILDVDLALVYRFNESFFMRTGPEVGVTLGGRRAEESAGTTAGGGASVLSISAVVGFGVNLEL